MPGLKMKPSVGPKHARPRPPAPPANEVTADNRSVCKGTARAVSQPNTQLHTVDEQKNCSSSMKSKLVVWPSRGWSRYLGVRPYWTSGARDAARIEPELAHCLLQQRRQQTNAISTSSGNETKADVAKCRAFQAKVPRRHGAEARNQSQPSPISATPATWNEGRCRQVPHLPRETKADVAKCRACHAKVPQGHGAQAHHQSRSSPISATPATWNEGRCRQVPHLPGDTKVDVAKRHACYVKRR